MTEQEKQQLKDLLQKANKEYLAYCKFFSEMQEVVEGLKINFEFE